MNNLSPINDESMKVFDELFSRFQGLDTDALLVYMIDNVASSALPHLAQQFNIMGNAGWLQCKTEEEKRELIKNAINLHKYKGTKFAVMKIFEMLNLQGDLTEWFEYGGEPYHFMVNIDFSNRGLDFELIDRFEDLINEYKNERSKLEVMKIFLSSFCSYYRYLLHSLTGEVLTVFPAETPLIFDEDIWDAKNWSQKVIVKTNLPPTFWDSDIWGDKGWCFG